MSTIDGTELNDYLFGTIEDDEIFGGDGDDFISGGDGNDIIYDGAGDDILFGDDGNDIFIVSDNNRFGPPPVFDPFGGPQAIDGGDGYDILDATNSSEAINFAAGTFKFASIEEFIGSSSNDSLSAALVSFDVVISGQAGDDTLTGGSGNDRISGDLGADQLTGGLGSDVFEYASLSDSLLSGFDVIHDLVIESDFIEASFSVAAPNLSQLGAVAALEATAIADVLLENTFNPLAAATFTFEQRTFLAINDNVAGFQMATDAVIEISGFSGDLTNLAINAMGTSEVTASASSEATGFTSNADFMASAEENSTFPDAMLLL